MALGDLEKPAHAPAMGGLGCQPLGGSIPVPRSDARLSGGRLPRDQAGQSAFNSQEPRLLDSAQRSAHKRLTCTGEPFQRSGKKPVAGSHPCLEPRNLTKPAHQIRHRLGLLRRSAFPSSRGDGSSCCRPPSLRPTAFNKIPPSRPLMAMSKPKPGNGWLVGQNRAGNWGPVDPRAPKIDLQFCFASIRD